VQPAEEADAIVAHAEVNEHHGVGVLLKRLFGDHKNVLSIRSRDLYGGRQAFGAMNVCISHGDVSRDQVVWNVLQALGGATVARVLCVPYYPDDALNAIALKEAFGISLCTFLMDDQNLCTDGIPDRLMAELLGKSSLRLAISPEMCAGYTAKYGTKVWFMPPVAPTGLLSLRLNEVTGQPLRERPAVILGNIWGQQWLDLLRDTVRGSGISVRWYTNAGLRWLSCNPDDLARDGILIQDGLPEEAAVEVLREAPFVIVPSGTLEGQDDRRFIAQMSFPSRIPFVLATSHAPMLVLGSSQTAAARIVTRFGIGLAAAYERSAFLEGVQRITHPETNLAMRRAAFRLSMRFADLGAAEWLWQSLSKGEPVDYRYEDLMGDPSQTYR